MLCIQYLMYTEQVNQCHFILSLSVIIGNFQPPQVLNSKKLTNFTRVTAGRLVHT